MTPLGDKVLIKPEKIEQAKTEAGIEYDKKEPYRRGEIIKISIDLALGTALKVGDKVLYDKAGTEVEFDKQVYVLVSEQNIVMIL